MFSAKTKKMMKSSALAGCIVGIMACLTLVIPSRAWGPPAQQPAAQSTPAAQVLGAIKTINGSTITLTPDKGSELTVTAQANVRLLRVAPGQTDLKSATAIQLSDLQVGDRILVRGKASDDGKSFTAGVIIAMKATDLEAKKKQDAADWQRRGIGGLVSAVDPVTGAITIAVAAPGGVKSITVHTTKDTILRRYTPDSVQFDDAKASSLDQVKAGDQLRARGTRSADGADFAAEEIVSGAFRNIAGTINEVDAAANTVTVTDLVLKKPVTVKITAQSQVVKLPPQVAQGVAFRLKGGAGAGAPGAAAGTAAGGGQQASGAAPATGDSARQGGGPGGDQRPGGGAGFARGGGGGDLQQIVGRLPAATLTDFQKGDAVMIVSTEGTSSGGVTAITMLGGVEPILAAPNGQQAAMNLSPWNIGGGGGGEEGGAGAQ